MAFPPASSNRKSIPNPPQVTGERGPISTGNGGIKTSLKAKAASTKSTVGMDKTVNQF